MIKLLAFLMLISPAFAIVNGVKVPDSSGLAQAVAFIVSKNQACTGTLIAPKILLTAAHCIFKDQKQVAVFKNDRGERTIIAFKSTHIHPDYHPFKKGNKKLSIDLAIIVLATPAPSPPIAVIGGAKQGGTVILAGRGKLSADTKTTTGDLYVANAPIVMANETHLLIGGQGSGACPGDSGGPVMQGGGLVGVSMFASDAGKAGCGYLTGAIKIDTFLSWVNTFINK